MPWGRSGSGGQPPEQVQERAAILGREPLEGPVERAEVEDVVGGHRGVPLGGQRDAQPPLVVGVPPADEEPPPLQVLDQDGRRALRQQQVLDQPAQARALADVGQQLALVLAQAVPVVVRPMERAPELAIQGLESSSL